MDSDKAIPDVVVVRKGGQYVFRCRYCKHPHYHGAAGGLGHRTAHCDAKDSPYRETGYNLTIAEPEEAPDA